jgi:SAM-dependent methyltransferase
MKTQRVARLAEPKKIDLDAHLKRLHFKPRYSQWQIEDRLRQLMGPKRYKNYLDTSDEVHAGRLPISATYANVTTLKEANMLMSHQAGAMIVAFTAVADAVEKRLVSGARAVDLGCWTGALASWIGSQHPDVSVVGVDSLVAVICMAQGIALPRNVTFAVWDYARELAPDGLGKFDVLVSTFGIDFPPFELLFDTEVREHVLVSTSGIDFPTEERRSLDMNALRQALGYHRFREYVQPCFSKWREVAQPGATLATVLRLSGVEFGLAAIDGATEVGWSWLPHSSCFVRTADETFPCLVFEKSSRRHGLMADKIPLSWWAGMDVTTIAQQIRDNAHVSLSDAAAVLAYRLLRQRRVQRDEYETYSDGHIMRTETGIAGKHAYIATQATTGYSELKVMPVRDLESAGV